MKVADLLVLQKANKFMYVNKNMNIVIPCAGAAKRFKEVGFQMPKPLIPVLGKPMIQWVLESLKIDAQYTFIVQKQHDAEFDLSGELIKLKPGANIVYTDGLTEGAACTVLLAKDIINNKNPLLICNSDQYIEWEPKYMFSLMLLPHNVFYNHSILTFKDPNADNRWSYAKFGDDRFVSEVVEKVKVSDAPTVGIYYFEKGSDWVWAAETMIRKDVRHAGEFYVAPSISQLCQRGDKVICYDVDIMKGLGTPSDLENFVLWYKENRL